MQVVTLAQQLGLEYVEGLWRPDTTILVAGVDTTNEQCILRKRTSKYMCAVLSGAEIVSLKCMYGKQILFDDT
jgi:hypothetical protein